MRVLYSFLLLVCLYFFAGISPGCSREYSFEGNDTLEIPVPQPVPVDTSNTTDTTNAVQINSCAGCSTEPAENRWSLTMGSALLCGAVDTAIVNPGRNTFTFFGPSTCSKDSGLIITVWMDGEQLNRDRQNLTLYKTSLYYYDKVGGLYVVQTKTGQPFSFTIERYNHSTGAAEGFFTGTCYTKTNNEVALNGKWKTFFH